MNCNIKYNIISTGSQGNAVVIEKHILIDCGVPFKALSEVYRNIKLVLLTHIHADHFNIATLRRLASERPTLRFGCCEWLAGNLVSAGVGKANIDVFTPGTEYAYGAFSVTPVKLYHNVPNCGYKLRFPHGRVLYATDTSSMQGIQAQGYDLYLLEANHEEREIADKIRAKKEANEYAYEIQAARNHLSKEKCDEFIYKNAGAVSVYAYLHCHTDKERPAAV